MHWSWRWRQVAICAASGGHYYIVKSKDNGNFKSEAFLNRRQKEINKGIGKEVHRRMDQAEKKFQRPLQEIPS